MVNKQKVLERLVGRTITSVEEIQGCIDIVFDDGSAVTFAASTDDDVLVEWEKEPVKEDNAPFHPYDLVDLGNLK